MLEFNAAWVSLWENTFHEKIKSFSAMLSFFFFPSWNDHDDLLARCPVGEVWHTHSYVGEKEELKDAQSLNWGISSGRCCLLHWKHRATEWGCAVSMEDFCISWHGFAHAVTSSIQSGFTTYNRNTCSVSKHGPCWTQGDLRHQSRSCRVPHQFQRWFIWICYFSAHCILLWLLQTMKVQMRNKNEITEAIIQSSNTS